MQKRVFLLEDDLQLNDTIKQFLEHQGYEVVVAYDALEAKEKLYEKQVDLMLLDIKVPFQNGIDLLAELREGGNKTPAIFITSLHSVEDVTRGFDAGCDDYIRKPFALKELQVRIESHLKRQFDTHDTLVDLGNSINFDTKEYKLTKKDKTLALKTKEAKLLALFLTRRAEVLSYETIFATLWDYEDEPSGASLRTYIYTLRHYLGKDSIETVKNIGYRFAKK